MEQHDLSQSILEKIKDKRITPKPRWTFLLHDYVIWFFALVSLLIGSASVSLIIFMYKNNDWEIYQEFTDSLFSFILLTLPYFWIVFLGIFVIVAYYNFQHTKKGYRYRVSLLVVGSFVISIVAGGLFYQAGIGQSIDRLLGSNVPLYPIILNPRLNLWSQPDQGRLAGVIIATDNLQQFMLLDPKEKTWLVISQNAKIAPDVMIQIGERIKMIGKILNNGNFDASLILPFGPPGASFFEERMHHRQIMPRPDIFEHPPMNFMDLNESSLLVPSQFFNHGLSQTMIVVN